MRAPWRAAAVAPGRLLRLVLSWRLQAEALGGLDGETMRQLGRCGPVRKEGLELGIEARLPREWRGRIVEVVVEADGFSWNGRTCASLSAAATAIAGCAALIRPE